MKLTTAILLVASPLLAMAVLSGNGAGTATAFDLLNAAMLLLLAAAAASNTTRLEKYAARAIPMIALVAVLTCAALVLLSVPAVYLRIATLREYLPWPVLAGFSGTIALVAVVQRPGRIVANALIIAFIAAGSWVILKSPAPPIDVWIWHQDALDAFVNGQSPYSITIPNIYGADTPYYSPKQVSGGRVLAGYPYPPIALLVALPGWAIAGDYRWSYLGALAASGWLLMRAGGRWGGAAASLLLLHPRALFVIEQGWTEPVSVLALSLTLWAAGQREAFVPWAVGVFVASKQHLVVLTPLTLLLAPAGLGWSGTLMLLGTVIGTAAATWLPFLAWDPSGLLKSTVSFHAMQTFRPDSLSYLPWLRRLSLTLPGWSGLAVASIVAVASARLASRGRASFALWTAVVLAATFALANAFANYWFLVNAAVCWVVATCDDPTANRESDSSAPCDSPPSVAV